MLSALRGGFSTSFRRSALQLPARPMRHVSSIGIVGVPNVGKSSLFNAMTQTQKADSANYPFCTIEPNSASVVIPDERLHQLAKLASSQKTVGSQVEFIDIAGLVRGAHAGSGLGNKFLGNIRNVDVILHVLRCFDDPYIAHVEDTVDPLRDMELIETELLLADLESVDRRLASTKTKMRKDSSFELRRDMDTLEKCSQLLGDGIPITSGDFNADEQQSLKTFQLLTSKPLAYVLNVDEDSTQTGNAHTDAVEAVFKEKYGDQADQWSVRVSSTLEESTAGMDPEGRAEFLELAGVTEVGLDKVIRIATRLLDVHCYYTVGPKEARSWLIPQGATAQAAAGKIHSDMSAGFIAAEVVGLADFMEYGGMTEAKAGGKLKMEGKHYIVKDGDVMVFRFKAPN